ncbi:MAG: UDP-glucose/GDP-mannose dehydrogenase family protein [Terriglobia bacterium]
MRISVIGCGYVGLVTGSCLAVAGHQVVCADSDESKIVALHAGNLPIYEPYLDSMVAQECRERRLSFTADTREAIGSSDVIFICVGTPPLENGDADLSAIDHLARLIATESVTSKLAVEKSTVPVQTGWQLKRALSVYGRNKGVTFKVASNPEFLREGTAVQDFLHPDRIVVGVEEGSAEQLMREIYLPILERRFNCPMHSSQCPQTQPPPFIVTTINSAELIKHAANSFLALKISYANMISDLCERLGADVDQVTHAMGLDPRIGPAFLRAGLGFGGFCLPKDIQAFMRVAERTGVDFNLLKEVDRLNRKRVVQFVEMAKGALWVLKDKQIAILGLAFKPNTDDIRSSPAIELIKLLRVEGSHLRAYDPHAMEKACAAFPFVQYGTDPYEAVQAADALMIATDWEEFRALDWERIRNLLARPLVLDGRNLLDPGRMKALGFEYHSFGRPDQKLELPAED